MTAPNDTAPDLMRKACAVMGYHVEHISYGCDVVRGPIPSVDVKDYWNMLRLIVAWIEARGGGHEHYSPGTDTFTVFKVWNPITDACGETLPLAAARWVCEHGAKIKEVKTDV